jgi:hypothetical protein
MGWSEERILTTPAGGLPRPPELVRLYVRRAEGEAVDPAARAAAGREALRWVVAQQIAAGIEVGNNGEQPRVGFFRRVLLYPRQLFSGSQADFAPIAGCPRRAVATAALRVRRSGQALPGGGGIAI